MNRNLSYIFSEIVDIESDKQRVNQVLINLVNNAIKFTEKGSVDIQCYRENNSVRVDISDTGIGIREEDIDKLFNPALSCKILL